MTRLLFGLAAVSIALIVACSTSTPLSPGAATASIAGQERTQPPENTPVNAEASEGTTSEPVAYNGTICEMRIPGTPSHTSAMFAIWNLGHAILDVPFNTARPDLYAILPGTMHHEPGHPELDHDHVVSHAPGVPGYDGTWDVWVVTPGQNFDAATYQPPRSLDAMFALIGNGVLAQPIGFAAAGFGQDLVMHAPLSCR